MDLGFFQILLIVLVTMIMAIDQYNFLESLYRPIVVGPIIGLIMGDLQTGLIIGASYELMMIGAMPVGGAQPPNAVLGGVIATVFGISLGVDTGSALALAIPFALLGQYAVTLLFTVMSPIMSKADSYAAEANVKGIRNINYFGMAVLAVLFGAIVLVALLAGEAVGTTLTTLLPDWVWTGLSAAGGMMPALGFAMLMKVMLSKNYLIFLAIGFVAVAYLNLPLLAVAIVGVALAVYDYQNNVKIDQQKGVTSDGI